MVEGLMQDDFPLTTQHVLRRMRGMFGHKQVTTNTGEGVQRTSYADVGKRVDKLCHALRSLGVEDGDRVGTFALNHQRHLELYLAIPSMGAVLHTINIRLPQHQLNYIVEHAQDKVIFCDAPIAGALEQVADSDAFSSVQTYVVMGGGETSLPNAVDYEQLLADQPDEPFDYPELDDRQAAGLCYTSGTTGNPKGVRYSHRSTVLHAVASCMADSIGITSDDTVLPVVPMFHVNAWGIPYSSTLTGADLLMPGPGMDGEAIAKLIEAERPTISGAVPTIWMGLLEYADEHGSDLTSLRTVICGGSAVPRNLMESFEQRHDMRIIQAWGMTETSPLGAVARPPADAEGEEHWAYRTKTGQIVPLVEARIVGEDDQELPWDDEAEGELEVRGPWIAREYADDDTGDEKFHDGWLRTGDVAKIDAEGFIQITDRAKDVIKSGGEWISSVELENEIMAHDDVSEAAVIARPDEKWGERPLPCVVLNDGASASAEELKSHLADKVAKWQVPEQWAFIDEVPKTSVGKFDKKQLRQRLDDGELAEQVETASG